MSSIHNSFKTQDWSDSGGGGLRYLEMLFRCNYLAMVGTGQNPRFFPSSQIFKYQTTNSPGIRGTRSAFGMILKRR